jgi:hypothetical protein
MTVLKLKKKILIICKAFSILIILALLQSLWSVSVLANLCNGGACPPECIHDFQETINRKVTSAPCSCFSERQGSACNLYQCQVSDVQNLFLITINGGKSLPDVLQSVDIYPLAAKHIREGVELLPYFGRITLSSPIFLQTRSLLC